MNESLEAKVAALQARVDELEAAHAPRRSRRWAKLILTGSLVVAATASAQLITFTPDGPAVAADVNANFTQLRTWLESKVGAVTSAGVTTPSVTTSGTVSAANVTASGTVLGANVTATNTLRTNSLVVTAGLPITIEPDFVRSLANDLTEQVIFIAADDGRRACFLAGMEVHDGMTNASQALCFVEKNGAAGWQLRIDVDTGTAIPGSSGDVDVQCRVRCISW
jgi:hypothetical protein